MEKYDIIIIGAGPGGLTAGIYAGRQGSETLILDKGLAGGIGREVPEMENYPGFESISGLKLVEKMKKQAEKYCELHENEEVREIIKDDFFTVNNKYHAKAIILATGSSHKHLNIPGEKEYLGRGVSYCATCDGLFFQNKDVVMIGGGNTALQEAVYLNNLGANVTIIHRKNEFRAQKHLQNIIKEKGINIILNSTVEEIKGDMLVKSVVIKDKKTGKIKEVATNGVFISVGYIPHTELAVQLNVDLDESDHIITDKKQKTNINNVYAAGDVCVGLKQWVVACGEGAVAATSAYEDIT